MTRLIVILVVLAMVGAVWALRRQRLADAQRVRDGERLPPELLDTSGQRTWVLVTAPMCAVCGPVEERLRRLDPQARVVTIDAAEEPDLARALRARAAPTLLLASPSGVVQQRLAGPEVVTTHLEATLVPRGG